MKRLLSIGVLRNMNENFTVYKKQWDASREPSVIYSAPWVQGQRPATRILRMQSLVCYTFPAQKRTAAPYGAAFLIIPLQPNRADKPAAKINRVSYNHPVVKLMLPKANYFLVITRLEQ